MKKILFISALLISINSNAQNIDNMCGTDVPENYFELLEENSYSSKWCNFYF